MISRGSTLLGLAIVAAAYSSGALVRGPADQQASVSTEIVSPGIEVSVPTDSSAARRQRKVRRAAVRSDPRPFVAPGSGGYPGFGYGVGDNSSCAC